MCKHRLMWVVAVGVVAAGVLTMQAFSQQGQGGPQGGGGGGGQGGGAGGGRGGPGGGGGGRFDPQQMRQMMLSRAKESVGATDEEWKVLGPKVEKVQTLSMQLRGGQRGMFGGGRGGRQEAAPAQPAQQQSAVEKAAEDLRTTLENKDAKPDDVKKKLEALREAREKAKQDLAQAQDELRQILTVKQEAQLVLMGLLD